LGLEVKPDWQIVDVEKQGVDFVGYVFFLDKTQLRAGIAERFKLHAAKAMAHRMSLEKAAQGLIAYKGWVMRANAKKLWRSHVPYKFIRTCDGLYKNNPLRGAI
jgi:hypothetical protein